MAERFANVIRKERELLHREREELQKKLAEVERELEAIDAYETTKSAKTQASPTRKARTSRAPARKAKQNQPQAGKRGGGRREALLQVLSENPNGLRRGEILARLGIKGNKSSEKSVSNALTALTKTHQLARQDGRYVPAQPE
jgi:hypothetical protein